MSRPGEFPPQPLRRTVRDTLASYGSHRPDRDSSKSEPMGEQPGDPADHLLQPLAATARTSRKLTVFPPSPAKELVIEVIKDSL